MSYVPNIRSAVAHVDEAAVARATRYHVWAVLGSAAIVASACFDPDVVKPAVEPYLPYLYVIPGFRALPELLSRGDCPPASDAAWLAFAMFLVFIPLSWLLYLARIGRRYTRAVRKVAESVVPAAALTSEESSVPGRIVVVDFGWSRDRYHYLGFFSSALYLILALSVLIDSLWHPHLIALACSGSRYALGWLGVEAFFGGLLAVMAPHAAVLMEQARLLQRAARR